MILPRRARHESRKQRTRWALSIVLAVAIPSSAEAAEIAVGSASVSAGESTVVAVEVEAEEPIVGCSFGIAHDPASLVVASASPGASVPSMPFFLEINTSASSVSGAVGVTFGLILDPAFVVTLPADLPHEVLLVEYEVLPQTSSGPTTLSLVADLAPPGGLESDLLVAGDLGSPLPTTSTSGLLSIADPFLRGDANLDCTVDIADVVTAAQVLFMASVSTTCLLAIDHNDDETLTISDVYGILSDVFPQNPSPPPAPVFGLDATPGPLTCEQGPSCP